MSESAKQLIAGLQTRDVHLLAKADRLVLDAPRGVLTPQEVERIRAAKGDLMAFLARPPADAWDRVEIPADATPKSLIDVCRRYGVGLRIDPDGTVVVESYGKAWRALVRAIAAQVDEIASILLTTGDGRQFSLRRSDG
jgi:hypothetical protein